LKENSNYKQIAIIGGGLAGLSAAIDLSKKGYQVVLFEKNDYPKHKVCGEFISNEVLPYFRTLAIDIESLQATKIHKTTLSIGSGKQISGNLPLGGFGISRYSLDFYLAEKAKELGCQIIHKNVLKVTFENNQFTIQTDKNQIFKADVALGAFGKRSNLDKEFNRNFMAKKSPWLAVKGHYSGDFANDLVELHNFEGGYCGVSKVEDNRINICYLVKYDIFKKYKNIADFQSSVMSENPHLKTIFNEMKPLFENPLTISQISFEEKKQVENHLLMLGDSAGLIHPLCGNGMAMAIHSAKIASDEVDLFLKEKNTRNEMEQRYQNQWNKQFKNRLQTGKLLSKMLLNPKMSRFLLRILLVFPNLLALIIKKTHGKPIY
jgi:flavin-dependent dehydrogenase